MNILLLSKNFNYGGIIENIITLSAKLNNRGHNVIVATYKGTNKIDNLTNNGVGHNLINFNINNPFVFFQSVKKLKNIINENKIDIVHCHFRVCCLYMEFLQKFSKIKVPYVWSNHLNNIPHSFIHKIFTFSGSKVITVSTDLKEFLIGKLGIPADKIEVVLNGIELNDFIPPDESKKLELKKKFNVEGKKVITLLGRLAEVKGHIYAIQALAKLKKDYDIKNIVLIFTGEGKKNYKESLIQESEALGVLSNIKFVGHVKANEILSISDLMISPSLNEGFLNAAVEAFAMKVPVIRTNTAGYLDMAEVCVGIEVGDTVALAKEIINIVIDNVDTTDIKNKAYEFVKNKCTIDVRANKLLDIYSKVIVK